MKFSPGSTPAFGKAWPIVKVVDWNRDGFDDVLVFHKFDATNNIISISYGGKDSDRNAAVWNFEPLSIDLPEYKGYEALAIDIADFDGDGLFDIVCGIRQLKPGQRPNSRIVFLKNQAVAGLPEFLDPEALYETPPGWLVDSIRLGGINPKSGTLLVGVSKNRGNNADSQLMTLVMKD